MGTGSAVLCKKDRLNETELFNVIKILESIFSKYEYYYKITYHENNSGKYYDIGLGDDDNSSEGLVMYCYGYPDEDDTSRSHRFDWIDNNLDIFIEIESISYGSVMALRILHDYFEFFPNDYFYTDEDIVFTKSDIDSIYNSSEWEDWYYSPAHVNRKDFTE